MWNCQRKTMISKLRLVRQLVEIIISTTEPDYWNLRGTRFPDIQKLLVGLGLKFSFVKPTHLNLCSRSSCDNNYYISQLWINSCSCTSRCIKMQKFDCSSVPNRMLTTWVWSWCSDWNILLQYEQVAFSSKPMLNSARAYQNWPNFYFQINLVWEMSTRMCSCLREVERWADVTPRGNCVSFLGMVGLRPSNVRQKKMKFCAKH